MKILKVLESICLYFGVAGILSFILSFWFEMIGYALGNNLGLRLIYISVFTGWLEIVGLIGAAFYHAFIRKFILEKRMKI